MVFPLSVRRLDGLDGLDGLDRYDGYDRLLE
jgi:hypothetical protein